MACAPDQCVMWSAKESNLPFIYCLTLIELHPSARIEHHSFRTHFKNASSRTLLAFPPSFIISLFVSVIAEIVILALESYLTFHRLSFMLPCTVLVLHAFLNCNSSWLSHVSFVVDPYLTRSTRLLCSCLASPCLQLTRDLLLAHSYII